jgi:hypothetical protein
MVKAWPKFYGKKENLKSQIVIVNYDKLTYYKDKRREYLSSILILQGKSILSF